MKLFYAHKGALTLLNIAQIQLVLLIYPLVIARARLTFCPFRLGTIFYISYFIFEYPQNLALQRFPVGRWMRQASYARSHTVHH